MVTTFMRGGLAVIGAVAVCAAASVGAQRPPVVCAGPDRVLRLATSGVCPAGQTRVPVSVSGRSPAVAPADAASSPSPELREVAQLLARLDAVADSATFAVVDGQGRPILTAGRRATEFYNAAGVKVNEIRASEVGGTLTAFSAAAALKGEMRATGTDVGLFISDRDRLRVQMARQPSGMYALRFPSAINDIVAGIGQSKAGSGAVLVGDKAGRTVASMVVTSETGAVRAINESGSAVVSLGEAQSGGGLFVLGDQSGEPTVKMGVSTGGYGVILAGPRAGMPYVPRSGLPGSYILGCAGGPACRPDGGD